MTRALLLTALLVFFTCAVSFPPPGAESQAGASKEAARPATVELAQFQLPQLPQLPPLPQIAQSVDWQEWDSFFTFVVKRFGQDVNGDMRDSLAEVFLDTRYELSDTVARLRAGENPIPQLLTNAWDRLSPLMNQALPGLPPETAERYKKFIGAVDALVALGQPGAQLGLLQISPDALRGMAQLVEPAGTADPLAFSEEVDAVLRNLLGFGAAESFPPQPPPTKKSGLWPPSWPARAHAASSISAAVAAAAPASGKLNEWVPGDDDLEAYLVAVRGLLASLGEQLGAKSNLSEQHKLLYRQIILAAGWQESCWRQYEKRGKPIVSPSGDLGLMQVNRNTWRNLYDLKRLGGDIEYNSRSGGEILLHYLDRYALKKGEHKQPAGHLARATYAAYNGGPRHLTRYRAAKQNPELKKVDEAFWEKFKAVSSGRELAVAECYGK